MKKVIVVFMMIVMLFLCSAYEEDGAYIDKQNQIQIGNKLAENQPVPTDIDYSLERYNLIRRTYWVNGMREKANALPCPVHKPLGYVLLFTEYGGVVGNFVVDGKVTSLNAYLTPDSEYYESTVTNRWLADVDGAYGVNDSGVFFFTPDGRYSEWNGTYLYSDIPFEVETMLTVGE